jgi:molybdopterin-guanine dinucleotide biosynthesis protein
MKLITISGLQQSGKATLIRSLITRLHSQGKSSAVIENEKGEATFDRDFMQRHGVRIEKIRGG